MEITGGTPLVGTDVDSHIDHRIAMSLAIAPLTLLAQLPFTMPKLLLSLTMTSLLDLLQKYKEPLPSPPRNGEGVRFPPPFRGD
jgi:hypothetical protein